MSHSRATEYRWTPYSVINVKLYLSLAKGVIPRLERTRAYFFLALLFSTLIKIFVAATILQEVKTRRNSY